MGSAFVVSIRSGAAGRLARVRQNLDRLKLAATLVEKCLARYGLPGTVLGLQRGALDELRAVRSPGVVADVCRVAATDPLNLVGVLSPGPRVPAIVGNAVLYLDGHAVASLEAGTLVPRAPIPAGARIGDDRLGVVLVDHPKAAELALGSVVVAVVVFVPDPRPGPGHRVLDPDRVDHHHRERQRIPPRIGVRPVPLAVLARRAVGDRGQEPHPVGERLEQIRLPIPEQPVVGPGVAGAGLGLIQAQAVPATPAAATGGVSRRYHSASSAAWQPDPAAVIAWR